VFREHSIWKLGIDPEFYGDKTHLRLLYQYLYHCLDKQEAGETYMVLENK
jgi:hypothetical protein